MENSVNKTKSMQISSLTKVQKFLFIAHLRDPVKFLRLQMKRSPFLIGQQLLGDVHYTLNPMI